MIYALWYGGASYTPGTIEADTEVFADLETATIELDNRYKCGNRYARDFTFADGREEQNFCPAVGADSEAQIWYTDPRGQRDPSPDAVIRYDQAGDDFVVEQPDQPRRNR
jgi:hypothetical protein